MSGHAGPAYPENVGEDFRVTQQGDSLVENDLSVILVLVVRDGGKFHDALLVQDVGVSVRAAVAVFSNDGLLSAILLSEHNVPTGSKMANRFVVLPVPRRGIVQSTLELHTGHSRHAPDWPE